MNQTSIDWTDLSWNPVIGCDGPNGQPCPYCYGRRMAARRMGEYGKQPVGQEFKPRFLPERLDEPLKLRKPSRIFVGSMTDLFGPAVKTEWLDDILRMTFKASWHNFVILTKQAERMCKIMTDVAECWAPNEWALTQNLWLGVSVTNQQDADERIPWLLKTPAAVHILSYEPMQGPITFRPKATDVNDMMSLMESGDASRPMMLNGISWLILGCETGNRAGKVMPKREWVETTVSQCRAAGVAVFEKRSLASIVNRFLIQEYPEVGP